jgi:hypothetical protein
MEVKPVINLFTYFYNKKFLFGLLRKKKLQIKQKETLVLIGLHKVARPP